MRFLRGAVLALLLIAVLVPAGLQEAEPAGAANAADFNPGYIISDENFYSGTAMSEGEIQSFLNAKGKACTPGYTCLRDYRQTTWSRGADPMCSPYSGGSNESSARIIAKVAAACGISPQVLLVTLEKEQSLVSASAPTQSRYDRATGYACPDTAPCDSQYFGFYNQVYNSAHQFKRYGNPPGTSNSFTWYPVGGVSQVRYHPNAACGSSAVRIVNAATAALYYYTPYQPNGAALANMYGTGDGCSSYGNRNFWRLYTDWFGSTTAPKYGHVDSVTGVYGGVAISGWSMDPASVVPGYIWVNIDGYGGPYRANKPLGWFNAMFPGYGPNHGFSEVVPAPPGDHEVCIYGTVTLLSCSWVQVPYGAGAVDSVTPTFGGVTVSGWVVDFRNTAPSYVWVNVNGVGGPYRADVSIPWINGYFPGVGVNHGYNAFVPAPPGRQEICLYGVYGDKSSALGCRTVDIPRGAGALDTVTAVPGGINVTGWSVDYTLPNQSYVWIDVDGSGNPYKTNTSLSWLPNYMRGIGPNNGYNITVPAKKGEHRICVYGSVSQVLGCQTVNVTRSADGSADVIEGIPGGVHVGGWSIDLTNRSAVSYIWVDVDGTGQPLKASAPLSWIDRYYPGAGPNHGFDVMVPTTSGSHRVCVYGTEDLLRCQQVVVP